MIEQAKKNIYKRSACISFGQNFESPPPNCLTMKYPHLRMNNALLVQLLVTSVSFQLLGIHCDWLELFVIGVVSISKLSEVDSV